MENLLEKISSYSLLNNIIPGAVFWYLCQKVCNLTLSTDNIIENILIYYFLGLIVSCIGSLIIEPVYKKIKMITYAKYSDFLDAVKVDSKIETLSEINNAYRTMVALGLMLALVKIYVYLSTELNLNFAVTQWLIIIFIFILFSFEHKKQTGYIRERVSKAMTEIQTQHTNQQHNNP